MVDPGGTGGPMSAAGIAQVSNRATEGERCDRAAYRNAAVLARAWADRSPAWLR
jgi:hypothetical protein